MSLEDFTTYTESDPNSHLSQTSTRSTFTSVAKDESCYLYNDKGAAHFDLSQDFEHLFDFCITVSGGGTGASVNLWCLWNALADYMDGKASSDALIVFYYDTSSIVRKLRVRIVKDTTVYESSYFTNSLTVGTTYYAKVTWTASISILTLYVYTDSERTTLLESKSVSQSGVDNLRYIMCPQSITGTAGTTVSGYVENLDLQEGGITEVSVSGLTTLSGTVVRNKSFTIDGSVVLSGTVALGSPLEKYVSGNVSGLGSLLTSKVLSVEGSIDGTAKVYLSTGEILVFRKGKLEDIMH